MSTSTIAIDESVPVVGTETETADTVIPVTRRRVDHILVGFGVAVLAVLAVAGGLLLWGHNFARDYVHDELAAQHIVFPEAAALEEEGRSDLVAYAGQQVDTGKEAEAYASYINGHLAEVADGATYADLGPEYFAAQAAVEEATASGAPASEVEGLQADLDELSGQRETLFKGDMLRGSLLNTYAWDTVGQIAGIAAIVAFVGAGVMLVLVLAGGLHLRRMRRHAA